MDDDIGAEEILIPKCVRFFDIRVVVVERMTWGDPRIVCPPRGGVEIWYKRVPEMQKIAKMKECLVGVFPDLAEDGKVAPGGMGLQNRTEDAELEPSREELRRVGWTIESSDVVPPVPEPDIRCR
jgi:hypothetical protein